ncbi:MAG: hypothetical protein IKN73_03985 [Alphaproteobacteria bacterium]|nr:hypothetical protein [Alphaproteobacteria bacterium]
MGSHIYRGSDCINNAFASESDKENLGSCADARDVMSTFFIKHAVNDLRRVYGFSGAEQIKVKQIELLNSYADIKNRKHITEGQEALSQKDKHLLKCSVWLLSQHIFDVLVVEAVLECRRKNGRFSMPLLKEQLKKTVKDLCDIVIR